MGADIFAGNRVLGLQRQRGNEKRREQSHTTSVG